MRFFITLTVCIAAIFAAPQHFNQDVSDRIIGGSVTTIDRYPSMAAVLFTSNGVLFVQVCGGSIINNRSVLTAAHCLINRPVHSFRFRAGSSWANSGGVVYNLNFYIIHGNFDNWSLDSDIGIMRSATTIVASNVVSFAFIAGPNYNAGDNAAVWGAGWGAQWFGGPPSEQLRDVQVWTVNQNVCAQRYNGTGWNITDNMLCSGWLDVGGRDMCHSDAGGPVFHNDIIIGVFSFGYGCALPYYPGVSVRVSSFTHWIQSNA